MCASCFSCKWCTYLMQLIICSKYIILGVCFLVFSRDSRVLCMCVVWFKWCMGSLCVSYELCVLCFIGYPCVSYVELWVFYIVFIEIPCGSCVWCKRCVFMCVFHVIAVCFYVLHGILVCFCVFHGILVCFYVCFMGF